MVDIIDTPAYERTTINNTDNLKFFITVNDIFIDWMSASNLRTELITSDYIFELVKAFFQDPSSNPSVVANATPVVYESTTLKAIYFNSPTTGGGAPTQQQVYALNNLILVAGTNITLTPDATNTQITIDASGSGGGPPTEEQVFDITKYIIVAGGGITVTNSDARWRVI